MSTNHVYKRLSQQKNWTVNEVNKSVAIDLEVSSHIQWL